MSERPTPHRSAWRVCALVAAATLVLAGCGDDADTAETVGESSTTTEEPTSETTGGTAAETTTAPETTETTTVDGTVLEVTVAGGEVTGGGRQQVDLGDSVTIRVTSDVTDHVHLHGYDVLADVAAGETAELTFDATIPGVFEVELEDARMPLLELEIS